jgi:large-conductance mechanosensitive channel
MVSQNLSLLTPSATNSKYFSEFISKNKILSTTIGFVIATYLSKFIEVAFNNIILPIMKDKNSDADEYEAFLDKTIVFYGYTFCYGKVIFAGIKFLIILYFMYLLHNFISMKLLIK